MASMQYAGKASCMTRRGSSNATRPTYWRRIERAWPVVRLKPTATFESAQAQVKDARLQRLTDVAARNLWLDPDNLRIRA